MLIYINVIYCISDYVTILVLTGAKKQEKPEKAAEAKPAGEKEAAPPSPPADTRPGKRRLARPVKKDVKDKSQVSK